MIFPYHFFSLVWLIIFWAIIISVFVSIFQKRKEKEKENLKKEILNRLREKFEKGEILIDEYQRRKTKILKGYK